MSELRQPRGRGAEVGHASVGAGSVHPPLQGPALVTSMPAKKENRPKKRPTTRAGRRDDPRLTVKRLLFIDEYLVDFNGAAAAVRAGYSKRSAAETAYKLLRNAQVLDRVMLRIHQRMKATEERADEEWKRIAEIAFGQLTDIAS